MNVPRVLTEDGYTRRLNPVSMNNNLNLQPLSMASMTLTAEDEISDADWVQIFTPDGKSGYYRVSGISTDTETGEKEVSLAHGACTLDDTVILETGTRKPDSMKSTITNIVTAILSKQQRWTVGTITCTDIIYIEMGGMSLMTALLTVMESIPDYQMEFVQASADDWHVDIKQRPTAVSCEGRLSRNLSSCQISYSADSICTRVYADGIPGGKMDSDNIDDYGVREQTMTLNDALTTEQKQRIVSAYLSMHDHPAVSIDISALELSQVTGLSIDEFVLGKLCRVIIPWLGIVADEVIVSKTYSDPLNDPEAVTISLANQAPDLSIAVAALTGGGGGSGGGSGAQGQLKRFQTKFEQTDEYFRLLATDTQWDELGNGTINAYSQIVQTASSLQSVVSRSGYTGEAFFSESTQYQEGDIVMYNGKMYEFQEAHKGAWNPAHVTQITGMYSSITQHEDSIESLVTKTGVNSLTEGDSLYSLTSRIKQTADAVSTEVTQARGTSDSLGARLTVTSNSISGIVAGTGVQLNADGSIKIDPETGDPVFSDNGGLYSKIQQNAGEISSTVSASGLVWDSNQGKYVPDPNPTAGTTTLRSLIKQNADEISQRVTATSLNQRLSGYVTVTAHEASLGVVATTVDGKKVLTGASVATAINNQTGTSSVSISGDKVDINGSTLVINAQHIDLNGYTMGSGATMTTLATNQLNVGVGSGTMTVFGTTNLWGTINLGSSGQNAALYYKGTQIKPVVEFDTPTESSGKITIPYKRMGDASWQTDVNFNIAATQKYIDDVAAKYADGWTDAANTRSLPVGTGTNSYIDIQYPVNYSSSPNFETRRYTLVQDQSAGYTYLRTTTGGQNFNVARISLPSVSQRSVQSVAISSITNPDGDGSTGTSFKIGLTITYTDGTTDTSREVVIATPISGSTNSSGTATRTLTVQSSSNSSIKATRKVTISYPYGISSVNLQSVSSSDYNGKYSGYSEWTISSSFYLMTATPADGAKVYRRIKKG